MKNLIRGIVDFRSHITPEQRVLFQDLASKQSPDSLFVACSDSRVVPNLFSMSSPGDLFVVRNVGNLMPYAADDWHSSGDRSEAGALEFSIMTLGVSDVIVCGHSNCGAMKAVLAQQLAGMPPNLVEWLRLASPALDRLRHDGPLDPSFPEVDQLSQLNVLLQMEHIRTFSFVKSRIADGSLRLHGWWFDIGHAETLTYDPQSHRFETITEERAAEMIRAIT